MQCDYFDTSQCRSCTFMGVPYAVQLADKQARVAQDLAPQVAASAWLPAQSSREDHFRNKAKLVVGGTPGAVTLGILDGHRRGVDLRHCGLHEEGLADVLPTIAEAFDAVRALPYDVTKARGELKHVLATISSGGEIMLRFVLRSERQLPKIEQALALIQRRHPEVVLASVNLQPEHKAVIEGEVEIPLTAVRTLAMPINDVTLHLGARSFFQTNTQVAAQLYRQAQRWVEEISPTTVWDLYCGVGGFAAHVTAPGRDITGVEVSADAVASAQRATGPGCEFVVGDATAYALAHPAPALVIVNPPRRGLDPALTAWLQTSGPEHLLYSSCNVDTLTRDLEAMPAYAVAHAQLFDMFPQTAHHEVATLLIRS